MPILRRQVIAGGLTTALTGAGPAPMGDMTGRVLWDAFKSRFVTNDGRVIDTANKGVSHTEGQGWGLLFAVAFDDEKTFSTILDWTLRTLRRPRDHLHAWRYTPDTIPPVADLNNASDGDIFIAASLARAALQWGHSGYAEMAAAISQDILSRLVEKAGERVVLLPASAGFQTQDGVIVNPSYYAFPFLADLARATPSPQWAKLAKDGVALITEGRFGVWQLPPDWLLVDKGGHLQPAPGWPPRFSFDAIRIPLWLVWSRMMPDALYEALHDFWTLRPGSDLPPWTDLVTSDIPPYPATPGIVAIIRLTEAAASHAATDLPPIGANTAYYDAALILLAHLAMRERGS